MEEEDWDVDEYIPQPVKHLTEEDKKLLEKSNRGRGKGRGRIISQDDVGREQNPSGSIEDKDSFGIKSYEGSTRGRGRRGRVGTIGGFPRAKDNNFIRGRGRGGHNVEGRINGVNDDKNKDIDSERDDKENDPLSNEERKPRGLTPQRGASGRTRSAGRILDAGSGINEKKDQSLYPRGRGSRRGQPRNTSNRSDGEDSAVNNVENFRSGGRTRGRSQGPRGSLERSKSFHGNAGTRGGRKRAEEGDKTAYKTSESVSVGADIRRGVRGRRPGLSRGSLERSKSFHGGVGGRGTVAEEKKRIPNDYIPPEPTEDEDVMFHSGITCGVHFSKYDTIDVKVTGDNSPAPINSFEAANLNTSLLENIRKSNYFKPTPVQKNAIPIIMAGRDLMACAQTGSGKTAAFLIPVVNDLLSWNGTLITGDCVEPLVVILSPTRELAIQIFQEARKFAHNSNLKILLIYGGTVVEHQLQHLVKGCHILVAVPGRLKNFVKSGHIKFSSVKYMILDEADRMLDLGFKEDINNIFSHPSMVPKGERRVLMFSATFPQEIQTLATTFMNNYLFLAVGVVGSACSDVQQQFYSVSKFKKSDKLLEILKEERNSDELIMVFVGMKRSADFLAIYLCENELPTTSIHGDRYQKQREEALADFKSGKFPILIATAVAARGLDIKNVSHVINYDLPFTIEEYIHRIGRTGRVGNCGKSTSFYDPDCDRHLAKHLVRILQQTNQPVPEFLIQEDAKNLN